MKALIAYAVNQQAPYTPTERIKLGGCMSGTPTARPGVRLGADRWLHARKAMAALEESGPTEHRWLKSLNGCCEVVPIGFDAALVCAAQALAPLHDTSSVQVNTLAIRVLKY